MNYHGVFEVGKDGRGSGFITDTTLTANRQQLLPGQFADARGQRRVDREVLLQKNQHGQR